MVRVQGVDFAPRGRRRVRRGGKTVGDAALSTVTVRNIIKRRCADSGFIWKGQVSGHSLHVAGAQSLAVGGASMADPLTAGPWTSPQMPCRALDLTALEYDLFFRAVRPGRTGGHPIPRRRAWGSSPFRGDMRAVRTLV